MPEIEKNSASKIGTLVRNELVQNHFVNNNKTSIEEFSNRCLQKLERREIDLMLCAPRTALILQLLTISSLKNVSIIKTQFTCCQDINARILLMMEILRIV